MAVEKKEKRKTTKFIQVFSASFVMKQTLNLQSQNMRAHHIYQKHNKIFAKYEKC